MHPCLHLQPANIKPTAIHVADVVIKELAKSSFVSSYRLYANDAINTHKNEIIEAAAVCTTCTVVVLCSE